MERLVIDRIDMALLLTTLELIEIENNTEQHSQFFPSQVSNLFEQIVLFPRNKYTTN